MEGFEFFSVTLGFHDDPCPIDFDGGRREVQLVRWLTLFRDEIKDGLHHFFMDSRLRVSLIDVPKQYMPSPSLRTDGRSGVVNVEVVLYDELLPTRKATNGDSIAGPHGSIGKLLAHLRTAHRIDHRLS